MLQEASKDPISFERFVAETMARRKKKKSNGDGGVIGGSVKKSSSTLASKADGTNGDVNGGVNGANGNADGIKKKGYQRIEEWDAEYKENMSKEQRMQWDAQRGGDRFRQNEILRHNLNSF